jgi:hypothetical protein
MEGWKDASGLVPGNAPLATLLPVHRLTFLYRVKLRVARNASTEVAVKKSVLRIGRQQEDLPNAAFLS